MHTFRTVVRFLFAALWVLAGVQHFRDTEYYIAMMPHFLPAHYELVIISGVTEILGGMLIMIPKTIRIGGWFLIAQLCVFLVVHVDMLIHMDRFDDFSPVALWLRIPIQFVIIFVAWWCTLRRPNYAR